MSDHPNRAIQCNVCQCAHHCPGENFCMLDHIVVGTHEANPTEDQCTDCRCFCRK